MSNKIHSTAIIGPDVVLGKNVSVGPYTVIEGNVTVGDDTTIANSCTIVGNTTIGKSNRIYSHAVIGSDPQDKKFTPGDKVFLEIGDENTFREFVTINPGTEEDRGKTLIGSGNLFMAYAHVAHDCIIGNKCILANVGTVAGHVTLEDRVILGGLSAVHQFARIGKNAIVGGCSKVVQDIPPYSMCDGHPARVYGINAVGLKRAGIPLSTVKLIKQSFKILFHSGLALTKAIEQVKSEVETTPEIEHIIAFASNSKRGLVGGKKDPAEV